MPVTQPLEPGDPDRLGEYRITARIGEGGQGVVYLARSPADEPVAIKLFHAPIGRDETVHAHFARELEAAKRVARFCTAQVLDYGMYGTRPYIVSEYVPGPSLQQVVTAEGPRTGSALERLAVATATALVALHDAGIVHRDLKPQNVIIGSDGPRVIDFGIAKALAGVSTVASQIIGTPAYMAPEQLIGGTLGFSVDVFAWAATMVFAATGRPPFGQDSIPAIMNRILHGEPDLGGIGPPLRDLLAACLAKEPGERPSARHVLDRLVGGTTPVPHLERAGTDGGRPSPIPPAGDEAEPPARRADNPADGLPVLWTGDPADGPPVRRTGDPAARRTGDPADGPPTEPPAAPHLTTRPVSPWRRGAVAAGAAVLVSAGGVALAAALLPTGGGQAQRVAAASTSPRAAMAATVAASQAPTTTRSAAVTPAGPSPTAVRTRTSVTTVVRRPGTVPQTVPTRAPATTPPTVRPSTAAPSPRPTRATSAPPSPPSATPTPSATPSPRPSPRRPTRYPRLVELGPGHFTAYCKSLGWDWVEYRESSQPGAYCVKRRTGEVMRLTQAQLDAGCRWRYRHPRAFHRFKGKSNYCYAYVRR
ncbi:hypothetical protein TBS_36860 [Thermobispora bispora]